MYSKYFSELLQQNTLQLDNTKMKFISKAILLNQNYRSDVSSLTLVYCQLRYITKFFQYIFCSLSNKK